MNDEPVLTAASIAAAATAILQVLFLWHVIPLDADPSVASSQQAALSAAVAAVVGLLSAVWARSKVTPV